MDVEADCFGKKAAVLGLARSGLAAARLLVEKGCSVYASDIAESEIAIESKNVLEAVAVDVDLGFHSEAKLKQSDFIVISPGIDPAIPILALPGIKDKTIVSEIELASRFLTAPMVGITGTNGKTTTTSLLGFICECASLNAAVAGNIGKPLSEIVLEGQTLDWVVVELSSFQLRHVVSFHPRITVMLNVSPDHMDRYPSYGEYIEDKSRIFMNQTVEDQAVLNAADSTVMSMTRNRQANEFLFHASETLPAGAFLKGNQITIRSGGQDRIVCHESELSLPGPHNLQNSLASAAAAYLMGLSFSAIRRGLTTFPGVEHRLETVASIDGIVFVNDSKATNDISVQYALKSFGAGITLIMGGKDKGCRYDSLRELIKDKVKFLITIGEIRDVLENDLGDVATIQSCDALDEAVKLAYHKSRPGDVVLLSPGTSSYDMFANFEERGKKFKQIVIALRDRN